MHLVPYICAQFLTTFSCNYFTIITRRVTRNTKVKVESAHIDTSKLKKCKQDQCTYHSSVFLFIFFGWRAFFNGLNTNFRLICRSN